MYDVTIIGAGIAGIAAATQLGKMGYRVMVIEKGAHPGGHVAGWDRLFPFQRNAVMLTEELLSDSKRSNIEISVDTTITEIKFDGKKFNLRLSGGRDITSPAVLVSNGFKLFDAHRKEEYGYGIYDNVITSADLEKLFASGKPVTLKNGNQPRRIAFIHCVGSRDEKVNNRHCSKVCCATAVKQASEMKQMYPDAEVYCFYMDLRMFDRYFENMYLDAQTLYGVTFIRGRLSEAAEDITGGVILRAEDTLMGKQLKITVDLVVLMSGMEASEQTYELAGMLNINVGKDGFIIPSDEYLKSNHTKSKGVFVAGTCTGPKTIPETLADARAASVAVSDYLKTQQ